MHPLVVAVGVQGQFAPYRAIVADRLQMWSGDKQGDRLAAVPIADIWMTKAAEVTDAAVFSGTLRKGRVVLESELDRLGIVSGRIVAVLRQARIVTKASRTNSTAPISKTPVSPSATEIR